MGIENIRIQPVKLRILVHVTRNRYTLCLRSICQAKLILKAYAASRAEVLDQSRLSSSRGLALLSLAKTTSARLPS